MNKKYKIGAGTVGLALLIGLAAWYVSTVNVQVLNPKGTIGAQEKQLMLFALVLSLVVMLPVFAMLFGFAWRYRAGNPRPVKYAPHWDHSLALEAVWWLIPLGLITILSVVTWQSSHRLDPFRPLSSGGARPLDIEVVALDWKWLFIYPQQHIATVNQVELPVRTPVNFHITADAPMNSFWIPQLGGQIYAMPGMSTELHLRADQTGSYRGSSANISGVGFSGMTFQAKAVDKGVFDRWAQAVQRSPDQLDLAAYDRLARPSVNNPPVYYSLKEHNLYDIIMMKYLSPIQGADNAGATATKAGQP